VGTVHQGGTNFSSAVLSAFSVNGRIQEGLSYWIVSKQVPKVAPLTVMLAPD
jgi:hypothetical protein